MGLLSWLFGKSKKVTVQDSFWLSNAARLKGVSQSISNALRSNSSVLVLAHFPASLLSFEKHCLEFDWKHERIPTSLRPSTAIDLAAGSPRILFGLVRNLAPSEFPMSDVSTSSPLPIIVLERHFLRRYDTLVSQFAEELGGHGHVEFHLAMTDPIMRLFAGQWVANMLVSLGLKEYDKIESGLVSRRFKKAQAAIAAKTTLDQEAASAEEWWKRNGHD
jgi:preprotein translocase subunit SecA